MSIMPLLMAAPINTPTAATVSTRLKEAARAPRAELRKFTASLLTPTDKSNTASRKRKMTTQRKRMSICRKIDFYGKGLLVLFQKCFKKNKYPLNVTTQRFVSPGIA